MDDFNKMKRVVDNRINAKESAKYRENSKSRLKKIITKKIQTTMIGAIASFEENFGHLFGKGKDLNRLTIEELDANEAWELARTEILNKGNTQIRNALKEIDEYTISWDRYSINLKSKE